MPQTAATSSAGVLSSRLAAGFLVREPVRTTSVLPSVDSTSISRRSDPRPEPAFGSDIARLPDRDRAAATRTTIEAVEELTARPGATAEEPS